HHTFQHVTPGGEAVLQIIGEMAYGFPLATYLAQIEQADRVNLLLSSCGGNSADAIALYDALQGKHVEILVMGQAYSAASLLLQAGTVRRIHADATILVHQPVSFFAGGPAELREEAD